MGIQFVFLVTSATCLLSLIAPSGSQLAHGGLLVEIGEPDKPSQPSAWQGPLKRGSCNLELGIIELPIALTQQNYLYVPSYSGSNSILRLIDLDRCKIAWESKKFAGKFGVLPGKLVLGTSFVALDSKCMPIRRNGPAN